MKKRKQMKYEVIFPMRSSGAQFSSITAALAFVAHCLKEGRESVTVQKI